MRFAFTLARALGKTVNELFTGKPGLGGVDEFIHWQAFNRLDPVGDVRADWRAANIAAMIGNANLAPHADPFKVSDFIWKKYESEPEKTPEQLLASIDSWLSKAG